MSSNGLTDVAAPKRAAHPDIPEIHKG